jgi:hypothetical protein
MLDNVFVLEKALDREDPKTQTLLNDMQKWRALSEHIFQATPQGIDALHCIVSDLYNMAMLNYEFYSRVAEIYAGVAQELPPPPKPPTFHPESV